MSNSFFDPDWTAKVIFYHEPSGSWYPLDDLRQGVLADAERALLQATWEKKLGWRPPPPAGGKKRK